jgi:hypothetical protein
VRHRAATDVSKVHRLLQDDRARRRWLVGRSKEGLRFDVSPRFYGCGSPQTSPDALVSSRLASAIPSSRHKPTAPLNQALANRPLTPEADVRFRVRFGARRLPPRPHADFDERTHRYRIFLVVVNVGRVHTPLSRRETTLFVVHILTATSSCVIPAAEARGYEIGHEHLRRTIRRECTRASDFAPAFVR